MKNNENNFNNYVSRLQEDLVTWPSNYLEHDVNYKNLLPYDRTVKLLEFGPGRGYFTDWALINGFENITLVELDADNCIFLRKKYANFKGITVVNDDMLSFLKDAKKEYSIIISKQVLEHVRVGEIQDVFSCGKEILLDGGVMIHETINAANLLYGTYLRYIDFSHTTSFTKKSIKEFGGPEVEVHEYRYPSIVRIIKCYIRKKEVVLISNYLSRINVDEKDEGEDTSIAYKKNFGFVRKIKKQVALRVRWWFSFWLSKIFAHSADNVFSHYMVTVYRKSTGK